MPNLKLTLDKVGRGAVVVDGVNVSSITSGINIGAGAGDATKVTLDLSACNLEDVQIQGAELVVRGERIPESVQAALYEFLRKKYDQVEVTVLGDDSRKFAIRDV